MKEPKVHVGILFEPQIEFILLNPYRMSGTDCSGIPVHGTEVYGKQVVTHQDGKILWNGCLYTELLFEPTNEAEYAFELLDVTIGINFHWERRENQRFLGALKIIVEDGKLTGINSIHIEDYLTSVISSEMSATASPELLKAHAVISRSWLLANLSTVDRSLVDSGHSEANSELIKWYERDAHTRFDVCADDHCQRYQGITRASTEAVKQAIAATRGQILMFDGKICDARFSKCCGGAFEEFQYCWKGVKYPYLSKQQDWIAANDKPQLLPDLTQEAEAERWIRTSPDAFCNTNDKKILSQVLNNYDQETTDFYRWKVSYTQEEISALVLQRSGIDYGQIVDLIPIARGTSGRLWKLKIVGTKKTLTIGKELEIRRTLSTSHLYSSAFVVDKEEVSPEGIPERFILTGAGWGHGVGLCQIGAAVMGEKGYAYNAILLHYYIGATIDKLYE
ncbi:SpoIID/LytB domain-containing protein [Bacteroides sp. UBA939]|uniref:SpoIID/LytB domain-containing protein n=1 Tax=Bacteroides sp. UBA939 TaxID=1946092 RepID=UPI0025C73907|nr:SpoIID/LytB domain-containing protein [Bacteroides sp. UBA939]